MSRLGLRTRLVSTTMAVALAAVTVLVVGVQVLLAHQSTRDSLDALRGRADAVASTIRFSGDRVRVLETRSDSLDQNVWVFDAEGRRVDGSVPPPGLRDLVDRLGRSATERSADVSGGYRLLARRVPRPGTTSPGAIVVAGLDLAPYEAAERRQLLLSLGLGLLTVLAAGAAAQRATGYALKQVREMAHLADEWREHDLSGRFAPVSTRDELGELGATLDRMLDRIAQAILTERRLTDEVAHELRTPLSVIRSEAQLARLAGPEEGHEAVPSEALDAILAATERMRSSIETMLAVARSAHADEQLCHPAQVVDHLRQHVVLRPGVRLDLDPAPEDSLIAAPLGVVGAAAVPLLDNAMRHAAGSVEVHFSTHGSRVELHVRDDGTGVEEERRGQIFEPGHSSTPDSAGLGLALARRLVHSVGGEVHERGNGHGHFVLSLPRG